MTDRRGPEDWRADLDRFAESGDTAARDRAIAALTAPYEAGEADEEQLGGLAMLLLNRYGEDGTDHDQVTATQVLGRLLAGLADDDPYGDAVAAVLGVLLAEAGTRTPEVAALLDRGLKAAEGEDRIMPLYWRVLVSESVPTTPDRLAGNLEELLGLLPEDHPARPETTVRLADTLAGRDAPGDHARAVTLYERAWEDLEPGAARAQVAVNLSVLAEASAPPSGNAPELAAAERWIRAALAEPVPHPAEHHAHLGLLLIRRLMPALPRGAPPTIPSALHSLPAALREDPALRQTLSEAIGHLERADRLAPGDPRIRGTLTATRLLLTGSPTTAGDTRPTSDAGKEPPATSDDGEEAPGGPKSPPVTFEDLRRLVKGFAELNPDLPQSAAMRLLVEQAPGEEELRAAVERLPEQDALRPMLLARLGIALQERGAAADALRVLVPALPALPQDDPFRGAAMTALMRAVLAGVRHDTSPAELDRLAEDLRAAAPDGPRDAATHLAWAVVHALRGVYAPSRADFDTAVTSFNRVIELLPGTEPSVDGSRLFIALSMGDRFSVDKDLRYLDDALEILDGLDTSPAWAGSPTLLLGRGVIRLNRSFYGKGGEGRQRALDELRRGFAVIPEDSPVRAGLAPVIDALETLDGSDPGLLDVLRMLALADRPETGFIEGGEAAVDLMTARTRLEYFPRDHRAARRVLRAAARFDERTGRFGDAFVREAVSRAWRALGDSSEALTNELAALRARLADVLVQNRPGRSLEVTRDTAEDALATATWALAAGRAEPAVEALELARGMTLYAATAGLPDEPAPGTRGRTVPVPTDARSEAVRARAAEPGFLDPPGAARIASGLGAAGWDALVYLLPSGPGRPGAALIVRPDGTVRELPLRGLDGSEAGRVRAYEEAHRRSLDTRDSAPLRAALLDLGGWAWHAVMRPLLDGLAPDRTIARVVLVPWGFLGAVPWQAAGDPATGAYACRRAVISFAASARQLIGVARPYPDRGADPAIMAGPGGPELRWVRWECEETARLFHASARRFGRWKGEREEAPATSAALLDLLPSGARPATLLHYGGHARSAPSAVDARLGLRGEVTVEQLLALPRGDRSGPLVVLSACTSDFTADDYDEALTLATALLAAGASTVIGSRWAVQDDARTALMMVMFHAFLRARDPAEALRRTQAWMLAPSRADLPEGISAGLVRLAFERDLADPVIWAAFTHQGR